MSLLATMASWENHGTDNSCAILWKASRALFDRYARSPESSRIPNGRYPKSLSAMATAQKFNSPLLCECKNGTNTRKNWKNKQKNNKKCISVLSYWEAKFNFFKKKVPCYKQALKTNEKKTNERDQGLKRIKLVRKGRDLYWRRGSAIYRCWLGVDSPLQLAMERKIKERKQKGAKIEIKIKERE